MIFYKLGSHLTIQLQSSYHTIFVLHWRKNIVHNLWCYHNPTFCRYTVIKCYLGVIILWWVHERHIAKSDFPQFPDAGHVFDGNATRMESSLRVVSRICHRIACPSSCGIDLAAPQTLFVALDISECDGEICMIIQFKFSNSYRKCWT